MPRLHTKRHETWGSGEGKSTDNRVARSEKWRKDRNAGKAARQKLAKERA